MKRILRLFFYEKSSSPSLKDLPHKKNDSAKVSKNLAKYRSENIYYIIEIII